jgi:hypothetical protein
VALHTPAAKITSMDEIFNVDQKWLQIIYDNPPIKNLTDKTLAEYFLQLYPVDVQARIKDIFGPQKTVQVARDSARLAGKHRVDYRKMHQQEKEKSTGSGKSDWRFKAPHEPGSFRAAIAITGPFTPAYGQCFHCNGTGHMVGSPDCINKTDPSTTCGPCGNASHPCMSPAHCPKRLALDATRV